MNERRRWDLADIILLFVGLAIVFYIVRQNWDYIQYFIQKYDVWMLLFIIINVFLYRYVLMTHLLKTLYQESFYKTEKHILDSINVGMTGGLGTGKSRTAVAVTQMIDSIFREKIPERIYSIQLFLQKHIKYSSFEQYFIDNFDVTKVYTSRLYKQFAYRYIKQVTGSYRLGLEKVIADPFSIDTVVSLLSELTELMYYRVRDAYVLSNIPIESVNTKQNSLPITESYLQMYKQCDLAHEGYIWQVKDEGSVTDNSRQYSRNDKKSVEENDDGKDIDTIFLRHGLKGRGGRLTIGQSEKDTTANRRRLWNITIELYQSKDVYIFNFEMDVLKWLYEKLKLREEKKYNRKQKSIYKLINKFEKTEKQRYIDKAEKLSSKYDYYLEETNRYKEIMLKIIRGHIYLARHLYIIQYMMLHRSADNVGKNPTYAIENKGSMLMYICYPAVTSYGMYATHAYFTLFDKKNESATIPLAMLKPFDQKMMTEKDIRRMDFKGLNKVFDSIQVRQNEKTDTSTNYDVFG